ncbi:MAG: 8-oxo-dGTP diphosphatase MutT [Psychrobium sp.]
MKTVNVAVAVILNSEHQVLLALRHKHLHQGGKWEFPGGKIEQDETVEQAMIREIKEEVGLIVNATEPKMVLEHDYGDKKVCLHVHWITDFSGNAYGVEGQEIKWVDVAKLPEFEFPDANQPIIDTLMG